MPCRTARACTAHPSSSTVPVRWAACWCTISLPHRCLADGSPVARGGKSVASHASPSAATQSREAPRAGTPSTILRCTRGHAPHETHMSSERGPLHSVRQRCEARCRRVAFEADRVTHPARRTPQGRQVGGCRVDAPAMDVAARPPPWGALVCGVSSVSCAPRSPTFLWLTDWLTRAHTVGTCRAGRYLGGHRMYQLHGATRIHPHASP